MSQRCFATVAAVSLMSVLLSTGCDRGSHPRELGKMAPAFSLHNDSKTISLSQYHGKVVLLNFWASWCAPCVEEVPSLMELHNRLPELVIIGISMDSDATAYRNFLAEHHIDFLTIRDPSEETMHRYGTVQIPESYLVDRSGHIIRKYISAQDWTNPEIVGTVSSVLKAKS